MRACPLRSAAVFALFAALLPALRAQVIVTESFNSNSATFLVSLAPLNSNLLRNGAVASATGENTLSLVRNGTAAGFDVGDASHLDPANPAYVWADGGSPGTGSAQTIYTFDTSIPANAGGYALTAVNLFSGWTDDRTAQSFRISYTTVGSSTPVYLVGDASTYFTSSAASGGSLVTMTTLNGGGVMASGVNSLIIDFNPVGTAGTGTVFREFEVIGTAIPEPASAAMGLALSCLVVALRRRIALGAAGVREHRRRKKLAA